MKNNLALITLSGKDHPGISAELLSALSQHDICIEDMGQTLTHGLLSLSVLVRHHDNSPIDQSTVLKEIEKTSKELDMVLDCKFVTSKDDVFLKGEKYIVSCVALSGISTEFLRDVTKTLAENQINIQRINNITEHEFKALDIFVQATKAGCDWESLKEKFITISNTHKIDLALLKNDVWRRNKRLIVFDMDSTLIQSEVIVEMAKVHNVGEKVHDITEKAMNGEYDFDESLKQRVALLKGLKEDKLKEILGEIKLTDGVKEFIQAVKSLGYKVAIISGGFNYFAKYFKDQLGLDYAFANELEIKNGELTGNVQGSIVNAEKKALLIEMLAQQENIKMEQVVAIGDGANDLPMLAKAGLGIAFHAKDVVKKNAKQHMSHGAMDSILYFLGIPGAKEYN
tara:strand:+ start:236881 stop:238074 length:1194 start_codon:yes stop_codon:yes gene_type:complete